MGARALADLRKQHIAKQRSGKNVPFRNHGGTVGGTVAGFGVALGISPASDADEMTEYDDAEHVREYLGDRLMRLGDRLEVGRGFRLEYLEGEADFSALLVPGDASTTTHQMAYVAAIEANCEQRLEQGLLFLLGAFRHSMWRRTDQVQSFAWTPSTAVGLRYAFHIGRGDPPETFNPVAGYELPEAELGHLADEMLVVANGALNEAAYEFHGCFVCEVHGCFYRGDEAGRHYPAVERVRPPRFCLFGAPLILTEED